ncbi:unnamed protein product [Gongylonema pulchrum]|uniref:Uncharacterized protein n=1 Tax=Gongylonema pulchrum TaxID=637853 RepID=A0A183CWE4_9BILA|nr:unnamed protein product [Gongylonema pulchrum]
MLELLDPGSLRWNRLTKRSKELAAGRSNCTNASRPTAPFCRTPTVTPKLVHAAKNKHFNCPRLVSCCTALVTGASGSSGITPVTKMTVATIHITIMLAPMVRIVAVTAMSTTKLMMKMIITSGKATAVVVVVLLKAHFE